MEGAHGNRTARAVEFVLLFVALPAVLWWLRRDFAPLLIPVLVAVGAGCLLVLLCDPTFDRSHLWRTRDLRGHLLRSLRLLVPGTVGLLGLLAVYDARMLFALPLERPWGWLIVLALYPVLSVWPQEVIYRAYLFHRYRGLFPTEGLRVAVSALAFGWAHLFFDTWIAVGLSGIGGLIFARTYVMSRSVVAATLEHAAWGNALFTLGWGWYFWSGSISA